MIRKFVSMVTALVLVMGTFAGCKKEDKEKSKGTTENVRVLNYFRESDGFAQPENMYYDNIYSVDGNLVYAGYMYSSGAGENKAGIYDTLTDEIREIDVSSLEINFVSRCCIGEKYYYICYEDKDGKLFTARFDKKTGELVDNTPTDSEDSAYIIECGEDDEGRFFAYMLNSSDGGNTTDSVVHCVYDDSMELVKSTDIFKKESVGSDSFFSTMTISTDESVYIFIENSDGTTDMTKFSPDMEEMYTVKDVLSDMNGWFSQCMVLENGNPVIATYDTENMNGEGNGRTNFNEIDALSGEIVGRYDSNEFYGYIPIIPSEGFTLPEGADILYLDGTDIYSYSFKYDEFTKVADFENQPVSYGNISCGLGKGSEIFFASYVEEDSQNGCGIYVVDKDGNTVTRQILSENMQIFGHDKDTDGNICFVCRSYNDDAKEGEPEYTLTVEKFDKSWKKVGSVELKSEPEDWYECSLLMKDNGNIVVSNFNSVVSFDSNGKQISSISVGDDSRIFGVFTSKGEDYVISENYVSTLTSLQRADYDKKSFEHVADLDFAIAELDKGDDSCDAFLSTSDGIYAYTVADNSCTEVINWLNSDIDTNVNGTALCIDRDNIIIPYYDNASYESLVKYIKKVDEQTLEKINNKKNIVLACDSLPDLLKEKIVEFNQENDNYRILVNDYYKYHNYADGIYSSGLNKLNAELIEGKIPDIIIGNKSLDTNRYAQLGIFADLTPYAQKAGLINDEEYFTNIIKAFSHNGKQYQLPLNFSLLTLAGKESVTGNDDSFTFDDFFALREEIEPFYMPSRQWTMSYLISDNLSAFVDFKNKKCDFENDTFVKLIEYIKEETIPDDEISDVWSSEEYQQKIVENHCAFEQLGIYSFESVASFNQLDVKGNKKSPDEKLSLLGIPSYDDSSPLISSDTLVSICEKSQHKDESWEFISFLFSDASQSSLCKLNHGYQYNFPIKKSVYDKLAESERTKTDNVHTNDRYGNDVRLRNIDKDTAGLLREFILSADRAVVSDYNINSIINEQCEIFFSDGHSAEDTAKAVQSRVSLYLQEIKN